MMDFGSDRMLDDLKREYPEGIEGLETVLGQHKELKPVISEQELEAMCEGHPDLEELLAEMLEYMYRYTADVCENEMLGKKLQRGEIEPEEFARSDEKRTSLHEAMMDSVNILSRALGRNNLDNTWIGRLKGHRAHYARLALQITYAELIKRAERKSHEE